MDINKQFQTNERECIIVEGMPSSGKTTLAKRIAECRGVRYFKSLLTWNKQIILSSHNPNHALALDSKVLLIDKEHNHYYGNAKSLLMKQEILLKVFGINVRFIEDKGSRSVTFAIDAQS